VVCHLRTEIQDLSLTLITIDVPSPACHIYGRRCLQSKCKLYISKVRLLLLDAESGFHLRFALITLLQENAKTNIGAWDLIDSIMMTNSESAPSFGHALHMLISRQIGDCSVFLVRDIQGNGSSI
jgi:hypothetical protein